MLRRENAARMATAAIAKFGNRPPEGVCRGRGIVICGGGVKYGACAWVLIRLLRELGCKLPIEVWALNEDEFDPQWNRLVEPYDVRCVNAAEVLKWHPHRRLGGWELKPYAIKHSRFREVLFLDADNVPVRDPSFLFACPQYLSTGTVFWPDPPHFKTPAESYLWKLFGACFHDSPDQESGQLLIDKARCWKALCLCNWYNEHSDFYYRHVYGDKETFRFAWQRLEQPISWPEKFASGRLLFTLEQHDFEDEVLFQHRFYRKWSLYGANTRIPGFVHEELCLGYLEELRGSWNPQTHLMRHLEQVDKSNMERLAGQRFLYDRPGHNRWPIVLGPGGRVTEGDGPNEHFWWREGESLVLIGADGRRKCELQPDVNGGWRGAAIFRRQMEIHLRPLSN